MDRVEVLSKSTKNFISKLVKLMKLNQSMKSHCRSVENRRWSFASYASSGYSTTTQGSNAVCMLTYLQYYGKKENPTNLNENYIQKSRG